MSELLRVFVSTLIALVCTCWVHPYILKVAKVKNIVDNPDARKLQRRPIPILGGLTVVFGIFSGLMAFNMFGQYPDIFPVFAAIIIILVVGLIDDMISLSARVRFVVEVILVTYLIISTGWQLNNFHGLWGIEWIPNYLSIPLTLVACVGIINAVNLIDGVDGYSSGYSFVSCILFGVMFYRLGDIRMVALAAIVAASLLPFFLHNVFGNSSKMFIGDAGSLSLGIIFSVFIMIIIATDWPIYRSVPANLGLVPFSLAVLCVPVFDTLRVMSVRMLAGKSPFHPDKTHLHHLFIELGYSHLGTTLSIIGMNLFVVLSWYLAYKVGFSVDAQLYVVVLLGLLVTFGFYRWIKRAIRKQSKLYHHLCLVARRTHFESKGFWSFVERWVDRISGEDIQ